MTQIIKKVIDNVVMPIVSIGILAGFFAGPQIIGYKLNYRDLEKIAKEKSTQYAVDVAKNQIMSGSPANYLIDHTVMLGVHLAAEKYVRENENLISKYLI